MDPSLLFKKKNVKVMTEGKVETLFLAILRGVVK
jgi:hypothetical protein